MATAATPGTLRQQQLKEQADIRNASLPEDQKHLATTYSEPTEMYLPELSGSDQFGKNDNNRRVNERLQAQKIAASGPKLRPLGTISVLPDAPVSDTVNPTVGEKQHDETDVAIAQATRTAVIDNKPVDHVARVGSQKNATGSPEVDSKLQNPDTPAAAAGAPKAAGWQRNAS
jgi:hypothetical protein